MTGSEVLEAGRRLPGAELTYPFGPQPAVLKVAGKVFALFAGPDGGDAPDRVTVKCDPEYATALVRDHPAITRGYHMNKRHWITVELAGGPADALPAGLAEELVVDSYDLVVDALPRGLRVAVDVARRDLRHGS